MTGFEWFLLLSLGAIWGGSFFFAKVATAELPTFSIVVGRVAIAAAALWLYVALVRPAMPRRPGLWREFLILGFVNNAVPFTLIFWGQREIASGLAAILNAMTPVFAVMLAHALTADEKLTRGKAAGVGFGVAGAVVLVGADALGGLGSHVLAQLAILCGTVAYALAGIYGRRFKGVPPAVTAAGQVTASSLIMLPIWLYVDRPWTLAMPGLETIGAMLGLALLCTAFGYILYFRILATAGATNLMLVTFVNPVSAILLGALILGERLEARHFAGMALIALGLAAIDGRPWAWLKARLA